MGTLLVNSNGEILTWEKFVEISKDIKKYANDVVLNENFENLPTSFSTMEDAESFFRKRGAITIEELDEKIMELKNNNDNG